MPVVEIGGTRRAASGEDQESLGYAEMHLRSRDIQWELARWIDGFERNKPKSPKEKGYRQGNKKYFGKE